MRNGTRFQKPITNSILRAKYEEDADEERLSITNDINFLEEIEKNIRKLVDTLGYAMI